MITPKLTSNSKSCKVQQSQHHWIDDQGVANALVAELSVAVAGSSPGAVDASEDWVSRGAVVVSSSRNYFIK